LKANRTPNVSVGVWIDRVEEKMDNDETRMTARNLEADHLALVVHGACSPEAGCGIGLSNEETIPILIIDDETDVVKIPSEEYVDKDLYEDLRKKILIEKIKEAKNE
jgi:hypothetical protein